LGDADDRSREGAGEFGELLRYTVPGYLAGIALGAVLDHLGLQRSGVGQWLVRTLAGEGESIFEGAFAVRQRIRRASASMAEAYGWGKLAGMGAPWAIDWASRTLGLNVYGVEGFYIPYLYALSDQIGANVSGLLYLRRTEGAWAPALGAYARSPVMLTSAAVVLTAPLGLLAARFFGFSPITQVRTALETTAANLCWLPPLVGFLAERRVERHIDPGAGGG
jgi:hypothetical protein